MSSLQSWYIKYKNFKTNISIICIISYLQCETWMIKDFSAKQKLKTFIKLFQNLVKANKNKSRRINNISVSNPNNLIYLCLDLEVIGIVIYTPILFMVHMHPPFFNVKFSSNVIKSCRFPLISYQSWLTVSINVWLSFQTSFYGSHCCMICMLLECWTKVQFSSCPVKNYIIFKHQVFQR